METIEILEVLDIETKEELHEDNLEAISCLCGIHTGQGSGGITT